MEVVGENHKQTQALTQLLDLCFDWGKVPPTSRESQFPQLQVRAST